MEEVFKWCGLVGAVGMPIFNIPLIVRIIKRKSSDDISLSWVVGVWACIVLMFPSSLYSTDPVLRGFGASNMIFFSVVCFVVLKYRKRKPEKPQ